MLAICAGLALAACVDLSPTAPAPESLAGTWTLRSTNGVALPLPLYQNSVEVYAPVTGGGITFTADGEATVRAITSDATYDAEFWYERDGDAVTFTTQPPRARLSFTLQLVRDSLVWNQLVLGPDGLAHPFTAIFTRQ